MGFADWSSRPAEPITGNDQMVVQFHTHQVRGSLHCLGELDILGRRIQTAAGVVVNYDDIGGVFADGMLEDFADPDDAGVERAGVDGFGADNVVLGVEQHHA